MSARFTPGPGLAAAAEAAAKPKLLDAARGIVATAKRLAPVDTGFFRSSLRVFDDDRGVGFETIDRAGRIIEFGSVNTPAHGTMRRASAERGRFEPS